MMMQEGNVSETKASTELRISRRNPLSIPAGQPEKESPRALDRRIQRLKAMNKAQLIDYILRLEEEAAGHGKNKRRRLDEVSSKAKMTSLANEVIGETLSFLSCWDLDAIPLVCCQFLAVYRASRWEQRRMLDEFTHNWGDYVFDKKPYTLYIPNHLVGRSRRTGLLSTLAYAPERHKLRLSGEELRDLLGRSPLLRARTTRLYNCGYRVKNESIREFASLWDGCTLVVESTLKVYSDILGGIMPPLPPQLDGCTTLQLCHTNSFETLWYPASWRNEKHIFGSEASGLRPFPRIELLNPCGGIEVENILDYLFASAADGKKRELVMRSVYDSRSLSPEVIQEGIKKQVKSVVTPFSPHFALQIVYSNWDITVPFVPQSFSTKLLLNSPIGPTTTMFGKIPETEIYPHQLALDFRMEVNKSRDGQRKFILKVTCS